LKINKEEIQKRIDQNYISVQKHPEADLYIYNYTQKCQFDGAWDEYTMMCRGLITDSEGNIVARPFKKFFNLEEGKTDLPALPFEIYEKYDGSLGILYWIGDEPFLATRGSFTSDQAIKGTEILRKQLVDPSRLAKNFTYLFEIIYPANRVVCDYGNEEKLIVLAVIETESGKEQELLNFEGLEIAKRYHGVNDISKLKELAEPNKEGFVIRFQDNTRVKVKFDEYVRLHKLVTGLSEKAIWELLKDGRDIDELLQKVPDEFFKWVKGIANQLLDDYEKIEHLAEKEFKKIKDISDRKAFALKASKFKYPSILFNMLDKRNYSEIIWKQLRPKGQSTFKVDEL